MFLSVFSWKVITMLSILYVLFTVSLNVVTLILMFDLHAQPPSITPFQPQIRFVLGGNLLLALITVFLVIAAVVTVPWVSQFRKFAYEGLPNLEFGPLHKNKT
jgi:hypothetical protein